MRYPNLFLCLRVRETGAADDGELGIDQLVIVAFGGDCELSDVTACLPTPNLVGRDCLLAGGVSVHFGRPPNDHTLLLSLL